MKEWIGCSVVDKGSDGKGRAIEKVLDATISSVKITQTKTSDAGINCTSWLDERQIKDRLTIAK